MNAWPRQAVAKYSRVVGPKNVPSLPLKRFAFSAQQRIRQKHEFESVFQCGIKIYAPPFQAWIANGQSSVSRLGLIVSKKLGSAPVRNRYKRICREWFRLNAQHFVRAFDILLAPKPSQFLQLSYEQQQHVFAQLLKQVNDKLGQRSD